eukprot:2918347-Karenia_brevis.AAC.1
MKLPLPERIAEVLRYNPDMPRWAITRTNKGWRNFAGSNSERLECSTIKHVGNSPMPVPGYLVPT